MDDSLKLLALGTVLGGTALLAWQLRPKDGFGAKKAAGAAGHADLTPQDMRNLSHANIWAVSPGANLTDYGYVNATASNEAVDAAIGSDRRSALQAAGWTFGFYGPVSDPYGNEGTWPGPKHVRGPGLQALAASLTPEQKAAVKAARASGVSAVAALASVGISPEALAAATR